MKLALVAAMRRSWFQRSRAVARLDAAPARPRLLVDVSVIIRHDAQTGIQRVVRAVWTHLLATSGDHYDVVPVFATKSHGYRAAERDFLSRPAGDRTAGKPISVSPGDKFLGLDLSAHLLPACERQIAHWRSKGATAHIVVYDLLPLQKPHWFNEKTVRNFRRWIATVRNNCDQALCISAAVAEDLRIQFEHAKEKPAIGRVRLAGDIEGSLPSRGIDPLVADAINRSSQQQTVLMVGTVEPRKGYDRALAAFEHLWRTDDTAPALVIVGKPGWRTEELQELICGHPEKGRRLFWLPNASDEGLGELYRSCAAVFLASHAEGFGLPAVEAAMHGRNALVRDLPVFREQSLPNLSFFSDDSPTALAASLQELLRRPSCPPSICSLPSWDDCVADLLREMGLGEVSHCSSQDYAVA